MGCAVSLGTVSCSDDDDDTEDQKKEQKQDVPDSTPDDKGGDKTPSEPEKDLTPEESGAVMKDIVEVVNKGESSLLSEASAMTTEQLNGLASTIIAYNNNKDNAEWKEAFIKESGSSEVTRILDETISELENFGVDMSEITSKDLVEAFSGYFKPVDQLGQGYKDGMSEGATHEKLFNEVYDDKIAKLDVSDFNACLTVFNSLTPAQQTELINVVTSWSNKENDEEWKSGFLKGVNVNDAAKEEHLRSQLDSLVPMINTLTIFM